MEIEILNDTPTKPFHKHWQFCVGSPHAAYALRRDYTEQLALIHDELGIERVRFHGVFCDDMHTVHALSDVLPLPGAGAYTERNFRFCGAAYDNVLSAGMQPFVELSFMPRRLARSGRRSMLYYKPVIAPPKSDAAWREYLSAFIRFLLDRYGKAEVESWFFEVWNEPDLRLAFFAGTQRDYFHFYEVTYRALKDVDARLQIGGPATSGSKWIADFLRFCSERRVMPDFVSTHQYAGDPLGGVNDAGKGAKLELDLLAPLKDKKRLPHDSILPAYRAVMGSGRVGAGLKRDTFAQSAHLVSAQTDGLPLYYTEWNLCASFGAPVNDTRTVASYDLRAMLAIEDAVAGSSVWCFTDLFEELHPFPEEFHGGFGMLTQSGIKKPLFHALKLLGGVGDRRYILPDVRDGGVDAAAFQSETGRQIVLTRLALQPADAPEETAVIRVQADSAPSRVTLCRIDETHGNPLHSWELLGAPAVPTPAQAREIAEASALCEEPLPYTYADGVLTCAVGLNENDVCFIRIE